MGNHSCPTCTRAFDSRRGLGIHHSLVHGRRLPNRACENCGEEFYSDYDRKYCSDECLSESVSYEGANNPNYRGGEEETTCEICGSEFSYYPSEKEGLYCPDCVETETWRHTVSLEGEENPRWRGGKLDLDCDVCGESFERHPGNVTGEVTVCSDDCRAEWLSESFAGDGHPNWQGGGNGSYGKGWTEVRRRALERDGYACVVCGVTRAELGRNPDVHHLTPVRTFAASDDHCKEDAHYLENVISLCPSCHREAEFGKIPTAELRARRGPSRENG